MIFYIILAVFIVLSMICSLINLTKKEVKNPAAYLTTKEQKQSIATIRDIHHGLLYTMDYSADYQLDAVLDSSITDITSLVNFISTTLLNCPNPSIGDINGGCSAFTVTSPVGDVLYGRNFDYKMDMTAVLLRTTPKKGYASIGLVDTGWINYNIGSLNDGTTDLSMAVAFPYLVMDGINEKGFSISILKLDGAPTKQNTLRKKITTTVAVRLLLDQAANVEEAIALLKEYDMNSAMPNANFHFLLTDATGQTAVIEYCNNLLSIVEETYLTNFYLTPSMNKSGHGYDRYDVLQSVLSFKKNTLNESEAMALLELVSQEETEEFTSMTQWSVVYNLTELTAKVAIRQNYNDLFSFSVWKKK